MSLPDAAADPSPPPPFSTYVSSWVSSLLPPSSSPIVLPDPDPIPVQIVTPPSPSSLSCHLAPDLRPCLNSNTESFLSAHDD